MCCARLPHLVPKLFEMLAFCPCPPRNMPFADRPMQRLFSFFYEHPCAAARTQKSALCAHSAAPAANPLHSDLTCVHRVAEASLLRALRLRKGDLDTLAAHIL